MEKSFSPRKYNQRFLYEEVILSLIHIYIYILIPKTQSKDRAITQSYKGTANSQGELFQLELIYALLNLRIGNKWNEVVI